MRKQILLLLILVLSASADEWLDQMQWAVQQFKAQNEKSSPDLKSYFYALRMHDSTYFNAQWLRGNLVDSAQKKQKVGAAEVRLGSTQQDFTLDEKQQNAQGFSIEPLPLLWNASQSKVLFLQVLDWAYREQKDIYQKIKVAQIHQVQKESEGLDLSEAPLLLKPQENQCVTQFDSVKTLIPLLAEIGKKVDRSWIFENVISLGSAIVQKRYVDSQGRIASSCDSIFIINIMMTSQSKDGMVLQQNRNISFKPSALPSQKVILDKANDALNALELLRKAPLAEPKVAPVILEGPAAAVLLHEILGHRIESHRFKLDQDGHTFKSMIGQKIMPSYINVIDDPFLYKSKDVFLNGYYTLDDQAVLAQKVEIVKNGQLNDFLNSRSVFKKGLISNGHGRAQLGLFPVARMGNLILNTSKSFSFIELRKMMAAELKKKNLEFGFIVKDLSGGFTHTDRSNPQSFKLKTDLVIKVYKDGRPDQIVRGLDIAGTPQSVLNDILAVGNDPQVFNGFCGAESGWIPVSAQSPSLLIKSMEFELQEQNREKAPEIQMP